MLLTALVTASVVCFWKAMREDGRGALLGWAFAGLAFLTKGPIGFVIPAMAGAGYAVAYRRLSLRKLALPVGIPICLAIAAPWYAAAQLAFPQFFEFFFLRLNVGGFLTKEVLHSAPVYAAAAFALVALSPWSVLLIPAAIRQRSVWKDRDIRFLALWGLSVVVFFTLSSSMLFPYVLPALPPLALVGGRILDRSLGGRGEVIAYAFLALVGIVGAFFLHLRGSFVLRNVEIPIAVTAVVAAALFASGMLVSVFLSWNRRHRAAGLCGALSVLAAVAPAECAFRHGCDDLRSARTLVERNRGLLQESDIIQSRKADYSLSYYLGKPHYFRKPPNELVFGASIEPTGRILAEDDALESFLRTHDRVVLMAYATDLVKRPVTDPCFTEVDRVGNYVLFRYQRPP